jgi:regulator of sigma E protease
LELDKSDNRIMSGEPTKNPEPEQVPFARAGGSDKLTLLIAAAVIAVLIFYFHLNVVSILKVVLGLSFVIFIHELGHFLVAKWCDVHVTHFSIGFGPKIPGCWFQWGETTYQVCMIPLGGYVQMVGQVDGDESTDVETEDDPRSYRNKNVPQRMAIISAGVIMNAIFALICFVIVYRFHGKDWMAGVICQVDSGGPAFLQGVRTGDLLLDIDGIKDPTFDDVRIEVGSSFAGQKIRVVGELPGQKPVEYLIEPRKTRDDPQPLLGLSNPRRLKFESRRRFAPDVKSPIVPTSPASRAEPAFEFDDEIVGTTDPADKNKILALPFDPRQPSQRDFFEFERRMAQLVGEEVTIQVFRREEGKPDRIVDIRVPPAYRWSIGARMGLGRITAIRKDSPADRAKLQVPHSPRPNFFVQGDLILSVAVTDAAGKPRVFDMSKHDPERLPVDLKAWYKELAAAANKGEVAEDKRTVKLKLNRHREGAGDQFEEVIADLVWDPAYTYEQNPPMSPASPLAIPELGLAYQVQTTVVKADPAGKLQDGDVIKNIKTKYAEGLGKAEWAASKRDLGSEEWATIGNSLASQTAEIKSVTLRVQRGKETIEVEVEPTLDKTWPIRERGWFLSQDLRRQRADTVLDAMSMGVRDTRRFMVQILQSLRQMVTGRVDFRGLGGPIMIAGAAYSYAGYDVWEFVFFLAMISVNLAVINFLPIPILDGGHMVFLMYEGLRGKPPSEGVRIGASYVGLAFLLGLMAMVFYLDISRLIF